MNGNGLGRAGSILIAIPIVLTAQLARHADPVALKPWASPLYWQPAQASETTNPFSAPAAAINLPSGANALVFVAMTPCRVVDTRTAQHFTGAFGPPSLEGGASRTFPIQSSTTCAIPTAARAYSFNITVVPPGPLGFITAYPTGQPLPLAATVNSPQGFIMGNAAIVAAGVIGSVDIYASDPTDIVIDINGYYAPLSDGGFNTTLGFGALASNTTGLQNTATGYQALESNTTGNTNTASGTFALEGNTTGSDNTASGFRALVNNIGGNDNTAGGSGALQFNTTGSYNSAFGAAALDANVTGNMNAASGFSALSNNTTGTNNTASGAFALEGNTTGSQNTALGQFALGANATGNNNIAVGNQAANNVSGSNSNNIHIGSQGLANDSGAIRIGTPGAQSSFVAAGVRGITTGSNDAVPVMIDSSGQLGTVSSSRRFKADIQDMGDASSDLLRLRPVTFRYKQPFADGSKPIQYGLIAEEVAEVYPDLVAHSADGQIETVKYQVLDSMLLNELQKEHQQVQSQAEEIRMLQLRLAALEQLLSSTVRIPTTAGR